MTPSKAELAGRLVLAMVLGGAIGLEREVRSHPAGLRTHATLALGAALFGMIGAYGLTPLVQGGPANVTVGVDRVASTVVTGVGFLGGGAILKHGTTVKGLTTAATLWVTAAVGLGAGLGAYWMAVVATAAALFALVGLRYPERLLTRRLRKVQESALIRLAPGADPTDVVNAVNSLPGVKLRSLVVRERDDAVLVKADVEARRGVDLEGRLSALTERPEVTGVEVS